MNDDDLLIALFLSSSSPELFVIVIYAPIANIYAAHLSGTGAAGGGHIIASTRWEGRQ